jgi:peroxiredoxin
VEYSSADGIRMNGVRNSFIEYCVMNRNGGWPKPEGRNLGGLGAWFFDAENCTIQFCEGGFVRGATTDAGAFDIDYWQKNSTVQYCYGHDCAGYGVSIFGADPTFPTENSVVRYNVFSNNGRDSAFTFEGDFFIYTWNGGLLNGVNVHDNISFWDPVTGAAALKFEAGFTGNNPNVFRNNIIHSSYTLLDSMKNDSLKCDSNTYWVPGGKPSWQIGKDKYYSLQDWQKATGQDHHSKYGKFAKTIPSWYKYPEQAKPFRKKQTSKPIRPGTKAPEFSAYTFVKQKISVPGHRKNIVLLSFMNSSDPAENDNMFSQLAFLKSMKRQFADARLKIILVVESHFSNESFVNFINDNELENIIMIQDNKDANIGAKYGVTMAPSTFLISADGTVKQKWEGLVLPAQLAFAIEDVLTKIN